MSQRIGLYIIALLIICSGSCTHPDKGKTIFRVAYVMAPGGTSHAGAEEFVRLVHERSKGRIKVKLYPNGILGNERVIVEGLELRSVDMVIAGPSVIGWYAPEYGVIEAPFVFRDYDHMEKVMYGDIGKEIEDAVREKRKLRFLAFFNRGPRYLTTTQTPVRTPEDLYGLKLRVPELPTYIKSWETFGANPTPIAYSDMFMALKQGVVDGQENPMEVIYTSHLYETQRYIMETRHLISFYLVAVGDYFGTKFSSKDQQLIHDAALDAADYQNKLVEIYEAKYKKELIEHGVEFIQVDRSAFEKLAKEKLPIMFQDVWVKDIFNKISNIK